ncbi:UPF0758 domain-containing protein [Aquihabitans sp. McL0605]|uniref:UPF0758 domain-containing protein n=1 Tax=Aquihabitans sp. McL0605 TaxID=3415671 RepID=UPI003CEB84D3
MTRDLAEMAEYERPRERLAEHGPSALRDAELLALVLRSGRAGESALRLAEGLLAELGGLGGLGSVRVDELARRPGLGPAKAAAVVAACHLAGRIQAQRDRVPVLRSVVDVADVAVSLMEHCTTDRVVCLVVDEAGRLRRTVTVTEVGVAGAPLLARDALSAVLHHGGAGLALVSNRSNGDPAPVEEDRVVAAAVASGAASVGLGFVASVVVAGRSWEEVPVPARRHPLG